MGASITMSDVGVVYKIFFAVLEAKLSLSSLLSGHCKKVPPSALVAFPIATTKFLREAARRRKGVFRLLF